MGEFLSEGPGPSCSPGPVPLRFTSVGAPTEQRRDRPGHLRLGPGYPVGLPNVELSVAPRPPRPILEPVPLALLLRPQVETALCRFPLSLLSVPPGPPPRTPCSLWPSPRPPPPALAFPPPQPELRSFTAVLPPLACRTCWWFLACLGLVLVIHSPFDQKLP